jgi:sialate O-acetylesterase
VPIGLVNSTWGGTPVEAWMSPAALASRPEFAVVAERWRQWAADYPAQAAAYEPARDAWNKADAEVLAKSGRPAQLEWRKTNPAPRIVHGGPDDPWRPAGLFNGMINPLLPFALRGAIWYQGESNADRAQEYHALFSAMITAWRAHFGQGDFPFYWVSLANFKNPPDPTGRSYAFLREAQTKTLALPNTGQALAIDIGNADDIHPLDKQDVGRRLALLAKHRVYGFTGDDTGPTFASATRETVTVRKTAPPPPPPAKAGTKAAGAKKAPSTGSGQMTPAMGGPMPAMRVRFTHAEGGLIARDKPVQSLELAGADRVFHPAEGWIDRDTLVVFSLAVKEPVAVRYAWSNAPEANLYNGAGLPAVPFRSDDW